MDVKEAIRVMEAYINAIDIFGTIDYKCINNLYKPVKTVLSELEKKDNDIQRMQELLDISDANNVKKDNIIDLMAKYIASGSSYMYATVEGIKEEFTKECEGK